MSKNIKSKVLGREELSARLSLPLFFLPQDDKYMGEDVRHFSQERLVDAQGVPIPRIVKEVFLLRVGTFNGDVEVTGEHLDEIAKNFKESDPNPIQVDHSLSAYDTKGFIRRAKVFDVPSKDEDGKEIVERRLHVIFDIRGKEAVENVIMGLWAKVSIGFFRKPEARLYEASFTPFPAVGGDGGEPARILTIEQKSQEGAASPRKRKGIMLKKLFTLLTKRVRGEEVDLSEVAKESEMTVEEVEAQMADFLKASGPETITTATAPQETSPKTPEAPKVPLAELSAAGSDEVANILKAHQEEIDSLKADAEEKATIQRLSDDTAATAELVKSGAILAKDSPKTLKFLSTCSAEQRESFLTLQRESKPKIKFGRQSTPSVSKPGASEADTQAEVAALFELGGYKKNKEGNWVKS